MENERQKFIRRVKQIPSKIKQNIAKGQKDFRSGKAKYYGSINPFKDILR